MSVKLLVLLAFAFSSMAVIQSCKTNEHSADASAVKAFDSGIPAEMSFTISRQSNSASLDRNGSQIECDLLEDARSIYCEEGSTVFIWLASPVPTRSTARMLSDRVLQKTYACSSQWPSSIEAPDIITCKMIPYNVTISSGMRASVFRVSPDGQENIEADFPLTQEEGSNDLKGGNETFSVNWAPTEVPRISRLTLWVDGQSMSLNCTGTSPAFGRRSSYNCR